MDWLDDVTVVIVEVCYRVLESNLYLIKSNKIKFISKRIKVDRIDEIKIMRMKSSALDSLDIVRNIAAFCDLIELLRMESVNHTWKAAVMSIIEEKCSSDESLLKVFALIHRTDHSNKKSKLISAWKGFTKKTATFILVGGCFSNILVDCAIISSQYQQKQQPKDPKNPKNSDDDLSADDCYYYYSFETRTESVSSSFVNRRFGASSTAMSSTGNRLLLGGWDPVNEESLTSIYSLDPKRIGNGFIQTKATLPESALCFGAATTLRDGRIVISGGGTSPYRGAEVLSKCYCGYFDDSDQVIEWKALPSFQTKRCGHAIVTLFDGSLVALGGYSGDVSYLSSVERLDIEYDKWLSLPSMSACRSGPGCVLGNDGCIYVAGGSFDGSTGLSTAERLDVREGKWQKLNDMM